jgi:hypothetical protein
VENYTTVTDRSRAVGPVLKFRLLANKSFIISHGFSFEVG